MISPFDVVVALGIGVPAAIYARDHGSQLQAQLKTRFDALPILVQRLLGSAGCLFVAWRCYVALRTPTSHFELLPLWFVLGMTAVGGGIGCLRGRFGFDAAAGFWAAVMMILSAVVTATIADR